MTLTPIPPTTLTDDDDARERGGETPRSSNGNRHVLWIALLVVAVSFGSFFMDGSTGINLADEGYLWYGMTALKTGQIPIRDFHAYDPGRYFWVTGWSYLLGDSLVSMRAACVLFQCLGMTCALLAVRRISREWWFLGLVALILVQWMSPQYKLFEQSVGLMAIYMAVRLIERPTVRQYFFTGTFIGLMAFFGRNHGLYQVSAFTLLTLLLSRGEWAKLPRRVLTCAGGIVVGYLPQMMMLAFVHGYFGAYVTQLQTDLAGRSGLPSPVPWPWLVPAQLPGFLQCGLLAEGVFYLLLPTFVVVALVRSWWMGREGLARHPLLPAAACVTMFYAQHSFARPEWVHLAHSVPGMILGVIALCHAAGLKAPRWLPVAGAIALLALTVPARAIYSGLVNEMLAPAGAFVETEVRGQTMHVAKYHAGILKMAHRVADELAKPDEPVVFLPHWPGLYPATGRFSPLYQIYFIVGMPEAEEDATIARFKEARVKWVVLQDYALDGRDDLRFYRTNPRIFAYLRANFTPVPTPEMPPNTILLRLND